MQTFADEHTVMQRALQLARSGQGDVEPNPCVGAVVVNDQLQLLGEGFHERFGGPHAEVNALRQAGAQARGAILFVTLEPCNHHGKTPPCTEAVIAAGISRVVIAARDPVAHVSQSGVDRLREAGIEVQTGLCEREAQALIAPFRTLATKHRPHVHAKWAMTMDGKIATRTGSSKWITNPASRAMVHRMRGRMDAIITGIGTVLADDPLLTPRPAGQRTPARIVLDSRARLPLDSQLLKTLADAPVIVVTTPNADPAQLQALQERGIEVLMFEPEGDSNRCHLQELMAELGRRRLTNVLVEAGGQVLGDFFDQKLIDEAHCFIAPKLAGGAEAPSPLAGIGWPDMTSAPSLIDPVCLSLEGDVFIHGQVNYEA